LRKKPTDAELKLWRALRDRRLAGIKFLRQFPIDRYVVDFICRPAKLVIELDGGQHEINVAKDQQRTDLLNALGYRVIRFWNNEVLSNLDGVLTIILHELGLDPANPEAPSPRGSGERAGGEGQSKKETKPC
jgi:very-short-patch-repair endonuclease